jgi:hypothetical protein
MACTASCNSSAIRAAGAGSLNSAMAQRLVAGRGRDQLVVGLARRVRKHARERKQARAIIVDKQYFWNLHVGTGPVLDGWAIQLLHGPGANIRL